MIDGPYSNQERDYLSWKEANPDGFVVNAPKPRKSKGEKFHYKPHVRLHLASCSSLLRGRGGLGEYTERGYYKICFRYFDKIREWCSKNMTFADESDIDWGIAACKRCCPL